MNRILLGIGLAVLVLAGQAATVYEVYRVQPGDTVESVAARYGMKPDELRDLNPFVRGSSLTPNELVTVMIRSGEPGAAAPAGSAGPSAASGGENGAGSMRPLTTGAAKVVGPEAPVETPAGGERDDEGMRPAVVPHAEAPKPTNPTFKSFAGNGAVARLGMVKADGTALFRERNAASRRLFLCPKGTKLAITQQQEGWFSVLMIDGSTGWVEAARVDLTATELVPGQASAASKRGQTVLREAQRYLGVPYVWGGQGFSGIDCSGLVLQAYKAAGVNLPRVSRDQFQVGEPVAWNQLQPGDRVYFASDGQRIDHTGLYLGAGRFIHASGRRRQVVVDNLYDPRYWQIYVGARR